MRKKDMIQRIVWFALFAVYVFVENHILYTVSELNAKSFGQHAVLLTVLPGLLSFIAALILRGGTLTKWFSKKYAKKTDALHIVLCVVCLLLSVLGLGVYTVFASAPISALLLEISSPVPAMSLIFGFASGYFFSRILILKTEEKQ